MFGNKTKQRFQDLAKKLDLRTSKVESMIAEYIANHSDKKPLEDLTIKINGNLRFEVVHGGCKILLDGSLKEFSDEIKCSLMDAITSNIKYTNNLTIEVNIDWYQKVDFEGLEIMSLDKCS